MAVRVGINGFGRIGRMALRAMIKEQEFNDLQVVAINSTQEISYMVYMLKYDSVHGPLQAEICAGEENTLLVNGRPIRVSNELNPVDINWASAEVDVVIEATGKFLTQGTCQPHIMNGARKVIQSAPGKDDTPIYLYGVNHAKYQGEEVISAASCTTNGLAPLVKVLNDHFNIKRGLMTTVHAVTASQLTVDGDSKRDWRAGRSAMQNIIPSSTGAAKSVAKIIPSLQDKLTGMAFRVPTANVSVVDLTCELGIATSYKQLCDTVKAATQNELKGVMAYTEEALVSTDFCGSPAASIFDASAGILLDPTFVKVVAWYDNEYGYTCNLLRLLRHISQ